MKKLTTREVSKLLSLAEIEKLHALHCDFTNRVIDGDDVEFSSSIEVTNADNETIRVTAYYYQDKSSVANTDDLGSLSWSVSHYTVD